MTTPSTIRLTLAATGLLFAVHAQAHTTIQVQATEGTTTYNNLVIGHGCTLADGTRLPVTAQSVVFPTVNPIFTTSGTVSGNPAAVSISSLANVAQLIQNRDIFSKQKEKVDARGNVIGFESSQGSLDPSLHGLVPFRTAGVSFPADSCATKLIVKVAVADICQPPYIEGLSWKSGTKNLWIPSVTAKYPDPTVDGIGSPASLTINRDLAKNPLRASCGTGYTLTVTPSVEDIDANLKLDGYLP